MIVDKGKVNVDDFLAEFTKRFTNFCNKSPVELSFKTTPTSVYVHEHKTNEVKEFRFDFGESVKTNIRLIRDWLVENKYPVMIQVETKEEEYTVEEIKELIEKGLPEDEALLSKKENSVAWRWRLERVIVRRDEFFVRNLETDEVYHFKMKMPCILFLKRFRERLTPFQAWEMFQDKSVFIQKIEETA